MLKKALMVAPTPILLCAEMDATACPMKYASGIIDASERMNTRPGEVNHMRIPSAE